MQQDSTKKDDSIRTMIGKVSIY